MPTNGCIYIKKKGFGKHRFQKSNGFPNATVNNKKKNERNVSFYVIKHIFKKC